jgi:hypothetical protein
VSAARDDLAAREPFRTPRVEAARQAGLARLDASAAFWSQVVEALKGGKPVSPELEKAGETLDDARRAWSRILKADPDE